MQAFVIFIMGPTATGKTDLAINIYNELDCEIISVDSAMVYRGMDIGTAKPDAKTLEKAPHHLIDICDPAEVYSAARFQQDASRLISEIIERGKIPLLVGGTGLYFRALEKGLADLPEANQDVRLKLELEANNIGWELMHERLAEVDPETAARINSNDPQRIQRALEVYELTGLAMSKLLSSGHENLLSYPVKKILLMPGDRTNLHNRIRDRYELMLQEGLVEEVRGLRQRKDLHKDLPAMRMVGYRQVWRFLDGEIEYDEMVSKGIIATRQLAKRQMTWFRNENDAYVIDPEENGNFSRILKKLKN